MYEKCTHSRTIRHLLQICIHIFINFDWIPPVGAVQVVFYSSVSTPQFESRHWSEGPKSG